LEAKNKEVNAAVSSSGHTQRPKRLYKTLRPTHIQKPGESLEEEDAEEDEMTHDPIDEREESPPREGLCRAAAGPRSEELEIEMPR